MVDKMQSGGTKLGEKMVDLGRSDVMEFQSVLDISSSQIIKNELSQFFARVLFTSSVPDIVSGIFAFLQIIQIIGPSILITEPSWNSEKDIGKILKIISFLWQGTAGYGEFAGCIGGIVAGLLIIVEMIYLVIRAKIYVKTAMLSQLESNINYIITKYLISFSIPFITSPVPQCFAAIKDGNFNALHILEIILFFICVPLILSTDYDYFGGRLGFDNSVLHEWQQYHIGVTVIFLVFYDICSVTINYVGKDGGIAVLVLLTLAYIFNAFYYYSANPFVFKTGNALSIAGLISAIIICVLNIIRKFVEVSGLIIFIALIVSYILAYFVISILLNKKREQDIEFLDIMAENDDDWESLLLEKFHNANECTQFLQRVFETSHPMLFNWYICDFCIKQYPLFIDLLIVYIRMCIPFPSCIEKVFYLTDLLSKLDLNNKFMTKLILGYVTSQRTNLPSQKTTQELNIVNQMETNYSINVAKFWESVLQRQTQTFWATVDQLTEQKEAIDSRYRRIKFEYPNCTDVIQSYVYMCMNITYNATLGRELNNSLEKIVETTRCEPDITLKEAISCFPGLNALNEQIDDVLEDAKSRDIQLAIEDNLFNDVESVQDFTQNTRIGSITYIVIYLVLAQAAIAVLSIFFVLTYTTGIITNVRNACSCFEVTNDIMLELSNYCLLRLTAKEIASGKLKTDDDTMKLFAKYLWLQKQIDRLEVSDDLIAESRTKIQSDLQQLTDILVSLSSVDIFKVFQEEISVKAFENGVPITTTIVDLLMEEEIDEAYFKYCVRAFDYLQGVLEKAANSFTMVDTVDTLQNLGIYVIMAEMCFFLAPYVIKLYSLRFQMENLADRYTKLPPLILSHLCSSSDEKEGLGSSSLLNEAGRKSTMGSSYISFTFTILVSVCFVVGVNYVASEFVTNEATTASSAAFVKTSQGTERLAACAELLVFMEYIDTNQINTALTAYKAELLKKSQSENTNSLVIISSQLGRFIEVEPTLNDNREALVDSYDHIPAVKCMLDRLSTQYYTHSTDNINFLMGITDPGQSYSDEFMYSQIYFYVNFVRENRENFYYEFIIDQIDSDIRRGADVPQILLAALLIGEFLSLFMAVGSMTIIKKKLYDAVQLLRPVGLVHILSDEVLLKLVQDGTIPDDENVIVFSKAESVIEKTSDAIIMLNRNLIVEEVNPTAEKLFGNEIINKEISEISKEKTPSWEHMAVLLHEILASKHTPSFQEEVEYVSSQNKRMYFKVGCFCACNDHVALEGEARDIAHIILCLTDETSLIEDTKTVEDLQRKTIVLLESILPKTILDQISAGSELIATIEASATFGDIKVGTSKKFNYMSAEPHIFYKKVYDELDRIMQDYPLTLKVRTLAHGYSFASGLFVNGVKPDRHAEEACKYALRILNSIPEISKKVGADVNFTIGIHTGGPVIAGVMSIRHPSLQLIGDVKEHSMAMKGTGDENTIHVTRSVYELIYFSGFNISESGDCEIRPGYVQPTYVIKP